MHPYSNTKLSKKILYIRHKNVKCSPGKCFHSHKHWDMCSAFTGHLNGHMTSRMASTPRQIVLDEDHMASYHLPICKLKYLISGTCLILNSFVFAFCKQMLCFTCTGPLVWRIFTFHRGRCNFHAIGEMYTLHLWSERPFFFTPNALPLSSKKWCSVYSILVEFWHQFRVYSIIYDRLGKNGHTLPFHWGHLHIFIRKVLKYILFQSIQPQ